MGNFLNPLQWLGRQGMAGLRAAGNFIAPQAGINPTGLQGSTPEAAAQFLSSIGAPPEAIAAGIGGGMLNVPQGNRQLPGIPQLASAGRGIQGVLTKATPEFPEGMEGSTGIMGFLQHPQTQTLLNNLAAALGRNNQFTQLQTATNAQALQQRQDSLRNEIIRNARLSQMQAQQAALAEQAAALGSPGTIAGDMGQQLVDPALLNALSPGAGISNPIQPAQQPTAPGTSAVLDGMPVQTNPFAGVHNQLYASIPDATLSLHRAANIADITSPLRERASVNPFEPGADAAQSQASAQLAAHAVQPSVPGSTGIQPGLTYADLVGQSLFNPFVEPSFEGIMKAGGFGLSPDYVGKGVEQFREGARIQDQRVNQAMQANQQAETIRQREAQQAEITARQREAIASRERMQADRLSADIEKASMNIASRERIAAEANATRLGINENTLIQRALEAARKGQPMDTDTLAGWALHYGINNTIPAGMGGANDPTSPRNQTMNLWTEIQRDGMGKTPTYYSSEYKNIIRSEAGQKKALDNIDMFINSIQGSIDLISTSQIPGQKSLMDRIPSTQFTGLTRAMRELQRQFNDPDVAQFRAILADITTDIARAFIAPDSSAMLTEGARQEYDKLFDIGYSGEVTLDTLNASLNSLRKRAESREGTVARLANQRNALEMEVMQRIAAALGRRSAAGGAITPNASNIYESGAADSEWTTDENGNTYQVGGGQAPTSGANNGYKIRVSLDADGNFISTKIPNNTANKPQSLNEPAIGTQRPDSEGRMRRYVGGDPGQEANWLIVE